MGAGDDMLRGYLTKVCPLTWAPGQESPRKGLARNQESVCKGFVNCQELNKCWGCYFLPSSPSGFSNCQALLSRADLDTRAH